MPDVGAGASAARTPILARLLAPVALVNETLVVVALAADLAVTFANTIGRYAFNSGIDWAPDLSTI